jgi:hypothetical protein
MWMDVIVIGLSTPTLPKPILRHINTFGSMQTIKAIKEIDRDKKEEQVTSKTSSKVIKL